jgi:penicillin-binding protein 1A
MLEGVIKRGTAYAAKDLPWTLAGKTGTTDDYTDAWFIGYSPDMIAGVWIGFDVKKSLGEKEVGAKAALPIWMEFVQSFLEGRPDKDFQKPDDIIFIPVDYHSGLRAIPSCETVIQEAFIRGNEPITYCSPQMHEILSRPYYLQRAEDNLPPQDSAEGAPDAVPQTNPPE